MQCLPGGPQVHAACLVLPSHGLPSDVGGRCCASWMLQAVLPRTPADLECEAAEKGYGKLYAHFGTAMAGLRACAAGEAATY